MKTKIFLLFPDMIVGSYSSNIVTVLRSRPIITLNSSMDIYPKEIPLNSSGQDCQDDAFRPCVSVNICFSYDGIDVPDNICKCTYILHCPVLFIHFGFDGKFRVIKCQVYMSVCETGFRDDPHT